jgi:hypothetical protein
MNSQLFYEDSDKKMFFYLGTYPFEEDIQNKY